MTSKRTAARDYERRFEATRRPRLQALFDPAEPLEKPVERNRKRGLIVQPPQPKPTTKKN